MGLTWLGAVIVMSVASCAKPTDTTDTRVMLTGKWNVSNTLEKKNNQSPPQIINYTGVASDFMDFQRDGNLNCVISGNVQMRKYTILSNEWLLLDADSFRIVQLMPDRLTLFRNNIAILNEYTINLTK